MSNPYKLHYDVPGDNFARAGEASGAVKKTLKTLGFPADMIRRVSIAMYEGEINMVIHANGGTADISIEPEGVEIILSDTGPGIPDIGLAMTEGYSTASEEVRNLGFGAGMGLPNMKKYTDEMEVDSRPGEGTTIRMLVRP